MRHTPGPWRRSEGGAIFGSDGKLIQICGEYSVRFGEGTEEALANARLIAAAPDLLEACKALLTMMQGGDKPKKLDDALTWRENDEMARTLALTAIAKAEEEIV